MTNEMIPEPSKYSKAILSGLQSKHVMAGRLIRLWWLGVGLRIVGHVKLASISGNEVCDMSSTIDIDNAAEAYVSALRKLQRCEHKAGQVEADLREKEIILKKARRNLYEVVNAYNFWPTEEVK